MTTVVVVVVGASGMVEALTRPAAVPTTIEPTIIPAAISPCAPFMVLVV
jgi:hypothetical protein